MLSILECDHKFVEIETGVMKCTQCGKVELDSEKFDEVVQDGNIWIPEEMNDVLIGKVEDISSGIYGKNYVIRQSNNNTQVTPSHKQLQEMLEKVKIGDTILIQFRGSKNIGKGNDLSLYKVWKKV